jgi:hypothetical protein
MEGRPKQSNELAISPWQALLFFEIPVIILTGWLFACNMGVAHFPRKWQGRAYMGSGSNAL